MLKSYTGSWKISMEIISVNNYPFQPHVHQKVMKYDFKMSGHLGIKKTQD